MIQIPMDILSEFPVRKSKQQKAAFRDSVAAYVKNLGYDVKMEKGSFGSCNIVIGAPENAAYLVTAHYDTCARLPFPNYLTPCSLPGFLFCQVLQILFIAVVAVVMAIGEALLIAGTAAMLGNNLGDAWILFVGLALPTLTWINVIPVVLWMIIGPANKSNVNDNASGIITLLEIAKSLPDNQRSKVCFVLFDLEEAGLIGASSYRKTHKKATDRQLVLNLDCLGDGNHILMIPTTKLKKDRKRVTSLHKVCGYFGKKSLLLKDKGFSVYPSDQRCFPYGVGICALNKGKIGLYLSRIHTHRDTVLDMTNVNILRAAIISYICCNAAN